MSTHTQRMRDIAAEMRDLAEQPVTRQSEARVYELAAEFEDLNDKVEAGRGYFDSDPIREPRSIDRKHYSNPWSINRDDSLAARNASPTELRERALSAVELMPGASDQGREYATKILEEHDDKNSALARTALATSDPNYLRWFVEKLTNGDSALHTQEETEAARRVRAEARAMSTVDTSGGYLIPFQLDPSVIITSDGTFNSVRRVSRKVQATGDVWHGVSSAAAEWSWDAEAEQVSDDATTFAQPTISIHAARGFIPISYEALMDAANVTDEIRRLLAFGRDTLESTALVTGTGSGEPYGIITALNGAAPPVVASTTNDTFGAVDVYKLDEAIPARYRKSASAAWMANRAILNDFDQMETPPA